MIQIHTRAELYRFLNDYDWKEKQETPFSSVFFLIKYDEKTWPIYFIRTKDHWAEYECFLARYNLEERYLEAHTRMYYPDVEYGSAYAYAKTRYRNGYLYEIETIWQSSFLPEELTIIKALSESECIEWLIQQEN